MDELSLLFQDIEFHERFRGYDPDEVDAYVDRVAKAAALVQGRLSELQQRAEAAEARAMESGGSSETEATLTRTLILAQRTADAAVAEAKEEAAFIVAGAESGAEAALRVAQAEASATTKAADENASRVMAEAETDKRRILFDAEAVAEAAASSEHDRLASEIAEFEQYRGFLSDDVEILERHLLEQRNVLAAAVTILTDLVDQPETFRAAPAPATSGIELELTVESLPLEESDMAAEATTDQEMAPVEEVIAVEEEMPVVEELIAVEEVIAVEEEMPVVEELIAVEEVIAVEEESPVDEVVVVEVLAVEEEAMVEEVLAVEELHAVEELPVMEEILAEVTPVDGVHDADEGESTPEPAPVSAWDEPVFAPDSPIDLTIAPVEAVLAESMNESTEEIRPADSSTPQTHDVPELSATFAPEAEMASFPPLLITVSDLDPAEASTPMAFAMDPGPATAPMPVIDEASLFSEPDPGLEQVDPFLAQLREAVAGNDEVVLGDDALSAFFDQDDDDVERSWFGKRR